MPSTVDHLTGSLGPAALARRLYAAYNERAPAAAAALYHPQAEHLEIATGQRAEGTEAIEHGLSAFFTAFPDARWEELALVADEHRSAVSYRLSGSLSARLGPFEPGGQRLELRGMHLLHVVDGAILSSEDYWDRTTFGAQMRSVDRED